MEKEATVIDKDVQMELAKNAPWAVVVLVWACLIHLDIQGVHSALLSLVERLGAL
jgi:hypothetical protein